MSKKLDNVLEKIKKSYDIEVEDIDNLQVEKRYTLESPGVNFLFSGGFLAGRMYMLQGPEAGGKTTLATYIASQVQKIEPNKSILFLDYEYSFSRAHAAEMGLDVDNNFILMRPLSGEDGFEIAKELISTGEISLVIIDSISSMSTKSQNEDMFKSTFGGQAALMSNGLRALNPFLYKNDCSLLMISQERQSMSLYGADYKSTSGTAVKYYSSWIGRVTRTEDITDKDKGLIGIKMKCRCLKSKLGAGLKREAILTLYFNKGIDSDDEYLDYLKTLGIIEQRGAWFYNEEWGMKVAGKNGVADFLHERPELYEKVKKQVNDLICGHTILDNETEETEEEVWNNITEDGEIIEE